MLIDDEKSNCGFDVRMPMSLNKYFIQNFLLKEDLEQLISIDELACPSLVKKEFSFLSYLEVLKLSQKDYPANAILLLFEVCGYFPNTFFYNADELRSEKATFLGYDIADACQISGLSNCGYGSDKKIAQEMFVKDINRFGLCENYSTALDIRDYNNRRVKEHYPFFVYKIYQYQWSDL